MTLPLGVVSLVLFRLFIASNFLKNDENSEHDGSSSAADGGREDAVKRTGTGKLGGGPIDHRLAKFLVDEEITGGIKNAGKVEKGPIEKEKHVNN